MKYILLASFALFLSVHSFGQDLPYVSPGQTFIFPNSTNKFLTQGNIIWALDCEEEFSFSNSKKIENQNIFNYLVTKVLSGNMNTYRFWDKGFEKYETLKNIMEYEFLYKKTTPSQKDFILSDSLKTIKFHTIYYLDNYSLKCKLVSSAPLTNFVTDAGVGLGLREIFFCCKDTSQNNFNKKDLVHLKTIERTVNFDSIPNCKLAKQTFGLDLVKSLWIGASQGNLNLIDIKSNQLIPTSEVLNYTIEDSVEVPIYDSLGNVTRFGKKPGYALFPGSPSSIAFTQDFYFDSEKNIFYSGIRNIYLFAQQWDETKSKIILTRRFKIESKNSSR